MRVANYGNRSDDGLSPGWHQAITWTDDGNCQLASREETSVKKNNWNKIYSIQENAFEHVCKMAAICLGLNM